MSQHIHIRNASYGKHQWVSIYRNEVTQRQLNMSVYTGNDRMSQINALIFQFSGTSSILYIMLPWEIKRKSIMKTNHRQKKKNWSEWNIATTKEKVAMITCILSKYACRCCSTYCQAPTSIKYNCCYSKFKTKFQV